MLERMQASILFSVPRALVTYSIAFFISLTDVLFIHLVGINTPEELLIQTLIHGTGFYLGYTGVAVFNRTNVNPN